LWLKQRLATRGSTAGLVHALLFIQPVAGSAHYRLPEFREIALCGLDQWVPCSQFGLSRQQVKVGAPGLMPAGATVKASM